MPITFGDYAGGTPESTETYQAANAQADTTHNSNVNNTSEVVLNHPAFYQVDGQVNGQVNGQVDNQVQAQQHSPNAEQAIAALNNHNFEQIDFDESIFDQTITEESITEETIQTGVYNYSESIKITAPESFLTQERLISAEEAKTTLFSVHPVHPLHADAQIDAQIDTQTDAQTKALGASNNVIETAINQQTLLHHAELLKGIQLFITPKLLMLLSKLLLRQTHYSTLLILLFNIAFNIAFKTRKSSSKRVSKV